MKRKGVRKPQAFWRIVAPNDNQTYGMYADIEFEPGWANAYLCRHANEGLRPFRLTADDCRRLAKWLLQAANYLEQEKKYGY